MKLWDKGQSIDELFERFTIGQDPILDVTLAHYDVIGSMAHVKMLGSINLLTVAEVEKIVSALKGISDKIEQGNFIIEEGIEDCHSQIELMLTQELGDIGKKVHSGRSRNDQVLTCLKLFAKDQLHEIAGLMKMFFDLLQSQSEKYNKVIMPGYTHMQVAMPSSFGLWFGAYAESLVDDLYLLKAATEIADQNPLGSAAGYGSSFPLDREMTAKEMGFARLNVNSVYAQMTRGKLEKSIGFALSSVAGTVAKLCMDVCMYSGENYNFFSVEKKFTTGSSIMPHKQNPDGFELVRAKCNQIQAMPYELQLILGNLSSGYHRDLQVLKEKFVPTMLAMKDCLVIVTKMLENISVNETIVDDPKYDLLFTVEEVNRLVLEGVPFRDAYKQVGAQIEQGDYRPNKEIGHTHLGSIGNLGTANIKHKFDEVFSYFNP
ncbi:MAG: argininosuccinate lyase [Cyclobacteriaceae bacterium]|jgi:argininosuccinate lyase